MDKNSSPSWKPISLVLALLVSGCAVRSVPPSPEAERLPILPAQGRVSLLPIPSVCLEGCTQNLTKERERSRAMLMR